MDNSAILYGSNEGNTKSVAEKVKNILNIDALNISDTNEEEISNLDFIIFATSTWGTGDLSDDWEDNIEKLKEIDLSNKKIAFLGLGDQYTYGSTFCDALNLIYEEIKHHPIKLVGKWPTEGYEYDESQSIIDGKFLGLIIDEDNEPELTDSRIEKWVEQLNTELNKNIKG